MQGRAVGGYWSVPDEPENSIRPVVRVGSKASLPFIEAANTPRLHGPTINSQVVAAGLRPKASNVSDPLSLLETPGDDGWHVDVSFGNDNPDFMGGVPT